MPFTTIVLYIYYQHAQTFFHNIHKTPHISENMTIWPRNSTKETGWGNIEVPITAPREILLSPFNIHPSILILKRPTKQLNPSHA